MIRIPLGQGARPAFIAGAYANRHGLITGATGTGKSYTLATMAEGFSRAGVPVFLADVKGDLAGLALPGLGAPPPVRFMDLYGERGAPVRVPVHRFGAELLARVLALSPTQSEVLGATFATTTARLDTLGDVEALLTGLQAGAQRQPGRHHARGPQDVLAGPATLGAILRALIMFRTTGADSFFGSPGFDISDLEAQPGRVTILAAERLILHPDLYAAFLLWLLRELYERAPEVGDQALPRLVLFFDEAHLLFRDAPAALIRRIEQTVRLIRSKGIGVYFASQSPADIPAPVAAQLGNRIQHAMRAATATDRREITGAADCLPTNPKVDAAKLIATMATGQALVSTIGDGGSPLPVELVRITTPRSRIGPISDAERRPFMPPLRAALEQLAMQARFDAVRRDPPSSIFPDQAKRPSRWRAKFWGAIGALIIGACGAPAWVVLIALGLAVTVL